MPTNSESLVNLAREKENVLRPFGQLDTLLLYGIVAEAMVEYLGDRELCGKNLIPGGPVLLKRGSKLEPLTAAEMVEAVDGEFLKIRAEKEHLKDARDEITEAQEKVWKYFFPRKYSEFLYATNHEGKNKPIDRIFYDIDRGENVSAEDSLEVTRLFVEFLREDSKVQDIGDEMVISWTGNSFHVEILMKKQKPHHFYEREIFTTEKEKLDTITERAIDSVEKDTEIKVVGGHEKRKNKVAIDPSQTPSGKLNRVPLGSLHMKNAEKWDGVSVPLARDELFEEGILKKLKGYTPEKVVEEIEKLRKKALPF